jgi:hypothetical protein
VREFALFVGVRSWLALASIALVSLRAAFRPGSRWRVVFDEVLQRWRARRNTTRARREVRVDGDATFVAFVYEEDCDVTLRLPPPGARPASEVNQHHVFGQSLEVAVLDVPRGAPLVLTLDSAPD